MSKPFSEKVLGSEDCVSSGIDKSGPWDVDLGDLVQKDRACGCRVMALRRSAQNSRLLRALLLRLYGAESESLSRQAHATGYWAKFLYLFWA